MYNTPPSMLVYNSGARTQYLGCWCLRRRLFTVTKHPAPVFPLCTLKYFCQSKVKDANGMDQKMPPQSLP